MIQFINKFIGFMIFNYMLLHLLRLIQKTCWNTNINRCFNLVSCQYPNFDSCLFHESDCIRNIILESILNCRRPYKFQLDFYLFVNFCHLFFSIFQGKFGPFRFCIPLIIYVMVKVLLSKKQRPEALVGKSSNIFFSFMKSFTLFGFLTQPLSYDWISAFAHKYDIIIGVLEDATHSLSRTGEFAHIQQFVVELSIINFVHDYHIVICVSLLELVANLFGEVDQG